MGHQLYLQMRDEYDFQPFNADLGVTETLEREPETSYVLPEGQANFYTYSPSFTDLIHPFRPSGSIIVEVPVQMGDSEYEMFLSGNDEKFIEFDKDVMERLEEADEKYYKKIL